MKIPRSCFKILAILVIACSILFYIFLAPASGADEVTTQELIDNMDLYNGQEVIISGEAIGDLLRKGDYGWITVNDDAYSVQSLQEGGDFVGYANYGMSVWAPLGELEDIKVLGGYKNKGDQVKVSGIFNRACSEHGGDTDIHAKSIQILQEGHPISHPFQYDRLLAILILAAMIIFLWEVRRRRIRKALRRV